MGTVVCHYCSKASHWGFAAILAHSQTAGFQESHCRIRLSFANLPVSCCAGPRPGSSKNKSLNLGNVESGLFSRGIQETTPVVAGTDRPRIPMFHRATHKSSDIRTCSRDDN